MNFFTEVASSVSIVLKLQDMLLIYFIIYYYKVGLGGLGVMCLPRDPRFTGSNQAEVDGFFQDVKILSISPSGGPESKISGSLKNLKPEK